LESHNFVIHLPVVAKVSFGILFELKNRRYFTPHEENPAYTAGVHVK